MKRIQALLAVAAFAAATTAGAASITVTWSSPIFDPNNADSVGVTIVAGPAFTGTVPAGRFKGTLSNPNPAGIINIFPDQPTIYAYCYELDQTLSPGGVVNYNLGLIADADVLNWLGAANAFLNGGILDWIHPTADSGFTAGEIAAAIQLGIWEGLYEAGGAFDLLAGNISFTGVNANTAGAFAAIKAFLGSPDVPAANVLFLYNRERQDVITGTDEQFDVPEPGMLVLLGFGALAAGLARRRTR